MSYFTGEHFYSDIFGHFQMNNINSSGLRNFQDSRIPSKKIKNSSIPLFELCIFLSSPQSLPGCTSLFPPEQWPWDSPCCLAHSGRQSAEVLAECWPTSMCTAQAGSSCLVHPPERSFREVSKVESYFGQDEFEEGHILVQGDASLNLPFSLKLCVPHRVKPVHEFLLLSVPWLPLCVPNLNLPLLRFFYGYLKQFL